MSAIQGHFPPEYINRIDEIILFRSLSHADLQKIVDVRLKEVQARLDSRKIILDADKEARAYLGAIGYSPNYGARPLNRSIQQELLNPLSTLILEDRVRDGEIVKVRFDGPHNRLVIVPNHEGDPNLMDGMDVDTDDLEIEEMD